jgi:hypothetical protein
MDEKYFVAKITYEMPDEQTGKVKKVREEKLMDMLLYKYFIKRLLFASC